VIDRPALRIVIVDDEAPARQRLRDLLDDASGEHPSRVVAEATNGRELLELLPDCPCDLVLLDIRMPGMDGLEAARHLRKLPLTPAVIFTTAYDDYAVKAFELHALDYLLKPIRGRRLVEALSRVPVLRPPAAEVLRDIAPAPRTHIGVPERGRLTLVPVADVLFLRAELKYVSIRTAQREFLLEESLSRLEQEFAERFVRIHRSCLVARSRITGFERVAGEGQDAHWVALLEGCDERLPVSRRQGHVIREFGRLEP
jgi:two-component system response regulator AlgR